MFGLIAMHLFYGVLMRIFSFRLMVLPYCFMVFLAGIGQIFQKGSITAGVISIIYALFYTALSFSMTDNCEDGTGNEFIMTWVFFSSGVAYAVLNWLS